MAKIAVELEKALAQRKVNGTPGGITGRVLAHGDGWTIDDIVCTSGPQDRRFEERHSQVSIAIVAAGSFQYRSAAGRELMTPGSLLLGNPGQSFECGHEHGDGDRCLSFRYTPEYFEHLSHDVGIRSTKSHFRALRLPPLRALSPLVPLACAGMTGEMRVPWEELSVQLAARTLQLVNNTVSNTGDAPPSVMARVTRSVRAISHQPHAQHTLKDLARDARLSPYHFLRVFEQLTGVTPHQYILRVRLREAAMRLAAEPTRILDIAFDCGFGDISNFNRAFRAEFGMNPRAYRLQTSSRA